MAWKINSTVDKQTDTLPRISKTVWKYLKVSYWKKTGYVDTLSWTYDLNGHSTLKTCLSSNKKKKQVMEH